MKGKVEQVTPSKTGKSWRVMISGVWYGAKFDTKLDQALGKMIDFTKNSDPKYGDWVETWDFDRTAPTLAPQAPKAETPDYAVSSRISGDRFYLPFVSNTVAHAIAAGVIKTPADLNQWAKAAYDAAQALDAL